MNSDLPIVAALTPAAPPALPDGATRFDSAIRNGLPHRMALLPRWQLVLALPTGTAAGWLGRPATAPIASGAPRLRFQLDGRTRHVVPLVRGPMFVVVDGGNARLLVTIIDWALHAGDMVGPGDFGSFLSLAVAAADSGTSLFGPVPPGPSTLAALPKEDRNESSSNGKRKTQRPIGLRDRLR